MHQKLETICVVGLGYIGLPTAAFIAATDLKVIGVDINPSYVQSVNEGTVPFYEPGFEKLLREVVSEGKLEARTDTPSADVFIVAVPTPFRENHEVDETFISSAATAIAEKLTGGELVILESTSPPGTTERMSAKILSRRKDLTDQPGKANSVYFAHCPERVLPGQIMTEMANNDRVIGGTTVEATKRAAQLYARFCRGQLLETNARTAEMAKLTENAFRDVNIAFANELSIICEKLSIDVWELIEIANHHPRVNILQPGPGVGGHCIAVDPWFIVSSCPDSSQLIRTARNVNDGKAEIIVDKIKSLIESNPGKEIGLFGLAFKPDIDDLRESPALAIAKQLSSMFSNVTFRIAEPNISTLPNEDFRENTNVNLDEVAEVIDRCGVLALLVDHKEFKSLDKTLLRGKVILDTRGCWRED